MVAPSPIDLTHVTWPGPDRGYLDEFRPLFDVLRLCADQDRLVRVHGRLWYVSDLNVTFDPPWHKGDMDRTRFDVTLTALPYRPGSCVEYRAEAG